MLNSYVQRRHSYFPARVRFMPTEFRLNGTIRVLNLDPDRPLFSVMRNDPHMNRYQVRVRRRPVRRVYGGNAVSAARGVRLTRLPMVPNGLIV